MDHASPRIHLCHGHVFLLIALQFATCDMWSETMVEVCHTHAGVDDGAENENDGDHGEGCEFFPGGDVGCIMGRLIHSEELE